MKKWINVNGKKMDSVEFTRFIRRRTAPQVNRLVKELLEKERKDGMRLERLKELG